MIKYRLEITKGEPVRYISHLDFAALMQRAICRAHLPAAYSEGFNPHMKIAFASALSVGITSTCEYMDLELKKDMCQPEVFDKLRKALPPGVKLLQVKQIDLRSKALMSIVDEASYEITLPIYDDASKLQNTLDEFNKMSEIIIVRETPKKRKEIEIKQYLPKKITFSTEKNNLKLNMNIKITSTGTAKPNEILEVLNDKFTANLPIEQALICRTGLYSKGKSLIDND
ncbi:TIGR03936 family radical SAM-associated protein [Megamonas hypermegale]|uniref:TIGR03936 family radical SAM-associated protein n=1 Tax=Megamonas hypermegale TaxID=158847 RepID=UPI003B9696BF